MANGRFLWGPICKTFLKTFLYCVIIESSHLHLCTSEYTIYDIITNNVFATKSNINFKDSNHCGGKYDTLVEWDRHDAIGLSHDFELNLRATLEVFGSYAIMIESITICQSESHPTTRNIHLVTFSLWYSASTCCLRTILIILTGEFEQEYNIGFIKKFVYWIQYNKCQS